MGACVRMGVGRSARANINEERDRRLELVKLLDALIYCVGGSFICSVFQHYSINTNKCVQHHHPPTFMSLESFALSAQEGGREM